MINRIVTFFAMVALLGLATERALAADYTVTANVNASVVDATIDDGGVIIFDGAGNDTITMNANIDNVTGITVTDGDQTIDWDSSAFTIIFSDATGAITLSNDATITFSNGTANNGFDFASVASGKTLTITPSSAASLGADVAGNILLLGNGNTVVFVAGGGGAQALDTVVISNAASSAPTIDVDAALAIDTLTVTSGHDVDFNIADNITCTVADAATLAGDSILEIIVDANANADILAFTGGLTLNGTSTLRFTNDSGRVNGTVTAGADGVTIDVNNTGTIATLTPTQDATIDIADGEQLTIVNAVTIPDASTLTFAGTNNAAAETLVFTGGLTLGGGASGTFNTTTDTSNALVVTGTIAPAAGSTLDIDASTNATVTLGGSATIDVAASQTLTGTTTVAANTLTLAGTGTLSRVDVTTGTITDNGGVTLSDLRALPGGGNTTTIGGTGSTTVTTLANALTGAANILNKVGTGALTITNGLTNAFDNAAGVLIDIDAGTLVVGSAGSNDDITFNDDADEITVASGAVLTTYGSFTVGADAANVNLDAAAGSTVNLSATSAKTFTGLRNDDFNLLGTVNINGSATYTISDAFNYKFGSVNISDGCGLVNNQPSGEMKFVPASTVTLTGNGTFTVNGQATGTRITMDTTDGSGTFTIARGSSTNLTIKNVSLSRCIYTSSASGPGGCHISMGGVVFVTGNSAWEGSCGGGGTPPPPSTLINSDSATVDADGGAIVSTNISSGTSAEVTVSGASEGETMTATLDESNTQGTFMGMAGGDSGEGNGIPHTLTVDSTLQDGTFSAVLQICVNDADLTGSNLTGEQIELYVFNESAGEWGLAGSNNVGNSEPTDNVGDYGIFQDGFESSDTCAWAVVDGFSVFAVGQATTYTLDASVALQTAGSVVVDPVQDVYSEGMQVNLTATPSTGFEFVSWLINDQDTSTSNPLTLAMDADTVVVAQIDEVDTVVELFTLTVGVNEAVRGTVDVSLVPLTYVAGTKVTLTATPASGFTFGGWSGSVDSADANTNPLTVTVDSDLDITAFFFPEEAALFTLEVSVDSDTSQSGTVAVSPALESYATGTEITLTATPADGFQFTGWTGDATETDNPLVLSISANLSIRATFGPATSGDLDETLGDSENVLDTCGTGAGCGAIGTLCMTLMLLGLAGLRRSSRQR